jgi:hypothetical protein
MSAKLELAILGNPKTIYYFTGALVMHATAGVRHRCFRT